MEKSTSSKKNTTSSTASRGSTKRTTPKNATAASGTGIEGSMLSDFFVDELKDIYWAEKHLLKALPKMQKAATAEELRNAFDEHLEVTKTHIERLEEAFKQMGEKAVAKKCDAMEGITKEGDSIIEDTEDG